MAKFLMLTVMTEDHDADPKKMAEFETGALAALRAHYPGVKCLSSHAVLGLHMLQAPNGGMPAMKAVIQNHGDIHSEAWAARVRNAETRTARA